MPLYRTREDDLIAELGELHAEHRKLREEPRRAARPVRRRPRRPPSRRHLRAA